MVAVDSDPAVSDRGGNGVMKVNMYTGKQVDTYTRIHVNEARLYPCLLVYLSTCLRAKHP